MLNTKKKVNISFKNSVSELKIQIKKLEFSLAKTQNENNFSEKVNSDIKNMKVKILSIKI